ncbi:hypothetical protein ABK905_11080 [Acerihabitans sp. KWT182]|uniref:Uncharacterized protein n=1 Tax=Acerihabitans sp. KWT182 TaxID=3157919 RepID=A0AAU7QGG9_9GAMM
MKINSYEKNQIKTEGFLKFAADELLFLYEDTEKAKINETIELKKGVTFADAKTNVHMLYKNAPYEEKENMYSIIRICC